MAISLVQVGGKITAALFNSIIKQVNLTALAGVVPTTVDGTGVTVSPNGKVTFTNASSVSLNGVFSGTYDNYRITWNGVTASTGATTNIRLRAARTDDSGTKYDWTRTTASGTTASGTTAAVTYSSSATAAPLDLGVGAGQVANGVLDLFGPALSSATTGNALSSILYSSALSSFTVAFADESTTAFDGFTLYPTTGGTWSGTVRVYGYNTLV